MSPCARPKPSSRLGFRLVHAVFAGCCQPLLGDGPSRRYLCDPCVGARTHTPPHSSAACVRCLTEDAGLTPRETGSTRGFTPTRQLRWGAVYRGCSHSFTFGLLRSLDLQIAPTAAPKGAEPPGLSHHAEPGRLPDPGSGVASCPTRTTDTAGLSPAGSQPCRLLLPAHGLPMIFWTWLRSDKSGHRRCRIMASQPPESIGLPARRSCSVPPTFHSYPGGLQHRRHRPAPRQGRVRRRRSQCTSFVRETIHTGDAHPERTVREDMNKG